MIEAEYASEAGVFASLDVGDVSFTPNAGFSGQAAASYLVRDALRRWSNTAQLTVIVKPDPNAAIRLFSFETGTDGWASASWQANAGSVMQSADFASDGSHSLRVDGVDGGWFGLTLSPNPLNLTPKTRLKFEIQTSGAGTSRNAAPQLTDGWNWCQGPWGWIDPGTTTTVDIDLQGLDCGITDVSRVQAMYVWFSGGGVFYLDNVRAE